MKARHVLGVVGVWAALAVSIASCHKSPEGFCDSAVEDACQALASCCDSGKKFDVDQCRIQYSKTCEQGVKIEDVHAGSVKFDSGAASDCLGPFDSCTDALKSAQLTTYDHTKACANVLTGFRPQGAACDDSTQCEKHGDFSTCFGGISGSSIGQICVAVSQDDTTCSFSLETNELHQCPDDKYCDLSNFKPKSGALPEVQAFEFSAPCKVRAGAGGTCFDPTSNDVIPCADGLFCSPAKTPMGKSTCATRKASGASCTGTDECALGLTCDDGKCSSKVDLYCVSTTTCGNGKCEDGEPDTCPQDCTSSTTATGCGQLGASCQGNADCCTFSCNQGQCDNGQPSCFAPGDPCETATDCCSGLCEDNQCAGQTGGCLDAGEGCADDSECCSGVCNADALCEGSN